MLTEQRVAYALNTPSASGLYARVGECLLPASARLPARRLPALCCWPAAMECGKGTSQLCFMLKLHIHA